MEQCSVLLFADIFRILPYSLSSFKHIPPNDTLAGHIQYSPALPQSRTGLYHFYLLASTSLTPVLSRRRSQPGQHTEHRDCQNAVGEQIMQIRVRDGNCPPDNGIRLISSSSGLPPRSSARAPHPLRIIRTTHAATLPRYKSR